MDYNVNPINEIKQKVKKLIQDNLHREVSPETKHKVSGIYMIYIDHFTSNNIVPIYIGQSKDIQSRYKKHFTEILALNRLSYDEYRKYFFSKNKSFYDGKFKACKIFKYMLENECTLKDFRMIILEEVEEEYLDEKEQEYFQRLLPSFFGFNQFNSFLSQLNFRFSNTEKGNSEIKGFLLTLQEDIKGIHFYYQYGFTRFNFEHAFPKDISYLLKEIGQQDSDILLKFNEVKISLYELCKRYITDFDEWKRLIEQINKLHEEYKIARDDYRQALDLLKSGISEKFEELKIYNEKEIGNFINSLVYKNNHEYKKLFNKYLKSKRCKLNFYKIFDEQIKGLNKKLEEENAKYIPYSETLDLYVIRENEIRPKRYELIFPSCQFDSYSLRDRTNNLTIKVDEDYDLLNTLHIQIYISNNGVSRNIEYDKEPYIIRFDYCYIDNEGNKTENQLYIDNEATRNCQSGIEYFEKDFYDRWVIRKERFKISSIINYEIDHSFISILAEYKHGINDYTIKDKKLIKLSIVLDEIKKLIDVDTRYNIKVSESANCLRKCMFNERLQKNEFVEILLSKKLPKIKRRKKQSKIVVDKTIEQKFNKITTDYKVKREETYKKKVLIKSDNAIKVINYVSSREKVTAQCNICGNEWKIRSDHLLSRPYCPSCKNNTTK